MIDTLITLNQQCLLLYAKAMKEYSLKQSGEPSGSRPPHPPLPVDSQAFDLLAEIESFLQEMWRAIGHRSVPGWQLCIKLLLKDHDALNASALAEAFEAEAKVYVSKAEKITDRKSIGSVLVTLTPSQMSDLIREQTGRVIPATTIRQKIHRGTMAARKVSYGTYEINPVDLLTI